jgi:hypothetical protein
MVPGNKMPFPQRGKTRRRLRRQPGSNPPQQTKRGRARRARTSVTSPTPSTHCAQTLPRAAWSISESAVRSRERSIRC